MRWPSFVNLFGAWFFLALIPLIILYFLKLRRPKMEVPSLVLWQSVVNDQRVNSPFQKFRRNLLLLLQILLLCLLVLALMQPFLSADAEVAQYMPVLIDCSASMAAMDEITGKSRLELVKEQVREQIESLSGDQKMSLFAFSATGRRLTDFTSDRRQLLKALELLEPSDLPGQLDDVLRMAAAYTRTFPIETVTIMTDGNLPDQVDFELPFSLDVRRVDAGGPNVGITEMSARRSGPQDWEVFVRVSGSSVDLRGAELKFFENNVETNTQPIEVSNEEAERLVFPVSSAEARLLEARLIPTSFDSMAVDNSVWLTLPAARPLKVWTSPKLASWRHAIRVLPNIEQEDGTDEQPKGSDYDLIISDAANLGGVIAPVQVFVGVIPDDLKTMIEVKEDVDYVVDWNRTAPFLRHVQLADLEIGEQPRLASGLSAKELEELGYEVLIDGKAGPLLLQRREGLSVSYWFTFHTDRSTLPYRVGFPIIAANAVESALKQASLSEVSAAPTGVLPVISVEADRSYTIKTPDGQQIPATSTPAGTLSGIPAAKVGRYDILDGNDVATSVGTGLLNTTESSLKAVEALRFTELTVAAEKSDKIDSDQPLWWTLALLAFGVMLFEWWYFQRARGAAA
ncbi:MAG: BatA and WFA domain-containing protein [Planctomycetales bacterium]|nr:BatA and WFA domain-containing protein [Planctomycetales bacterium]